MVRIIAAVLALVIVVGLIGTAVFVGIKTVGYMTRQNFDFGTAIQWGWNDFTTWISGIFGKANAEDNYFEKEITTNRYVDVIGCTSL